MSHVGQVPVENVYRHEQSLYFVLLLHVQIEDLLHGVGAVKLRNDVVLLPLTHAVGNLVREACVLFFEVLLVLLERLVLLLIQVVE